MHLCGYSKDGPVPCWHVGKLARDSSSTGGGNAGIVSTTTNPAQDYSYQRRIIAEFA